MKTRYSVIVALMLTILTSSAACVANNGVEEVSLWPEIEPYKTGRLKVSEIHELYYELCGNPEGKTLFVLHGGPGGSCSPYMRRFCDPAKFNMVLHDQRGAGRSKPYADLRENNTQNLVSDIETLREHLGLGKIILFGGSWGTTLALAYAEKYPGNVSGMVLRGVFTATSEEIDYFYHGGVGTFFPDVYEKFVHSLPEPDRRPLPAYLLELIQSEDPAERDLYSLIWATYEARISMLEITDEAVEDIWKSHDPRSFSLLENYYMANGCFLEEEQLLRDAEKLRGIPLVIVNGRYDAICPPRTAYKLHKKLPGSKLVIVESAGHWMGDPNMERALLQAVEGLE